MDNLTQLVVIAERRAKAEAERPFHNQNDADHRARCFHCLYEWWMSK